MFIREPFKAPAGSKVTYEVRYTRGRKPFDNLAEATAFAANERSVALWAEVNMIVSINVEPRS